jgi:hypothetical protein
VPDTREPKQTLEGEADDSSDELHSWGQASSPARSTPGRQQLARSRRRGPNAAGRHSLSGGAWCADMASHLHSSDRWTRPRATTPIDKGDYHHDQRDYHHIAT